MRRLASIVDGGDATGEVACCRYCFKFWRGMVSRESDLSERREVVSEASRRRGCLSFSCQPRDFFVASFVPRLV